MAIKELREHKDYKLVNMIDNQKEFAYSIVNNVERFEIYYLDENRASGFKYSRCYNITEGDKVPQQYLNYLEFLKTELSKRS